jgi:hypothetical protein
VQWDYEGKPGETLYQLMTQAMARYQAENGSYNLELIELHLNRAQYMVLAKVNAQAS